MSWSAGASSWRFSILFSLWQPPQASSHSSFKFDRVRNVSKWPCSCVLQWSSQSFTIQSRQYLCRQVLPLTIQPYQKQIIPHIANSLAAIITAAFVKGSDSSIVVYSRVMFVISPRECENVIILTPFPGLRVNWFGRAVCRVQVHHNTKAKKHP